MQLREYQTRDYTIKLPCSVFAQVDPLPLLDSAAEEAGATRRIGGAVITRNGDDVIVGATYLVAVRKDQRR